MVKVVFPMPNGNATVVLRPSLGEGRSLELSSAGSSFRDAGFFRLLELPGDRLRVWRIRSLKEHFRVYVDETGTLRCDHRIRFLGLPVLLLHYRIEETRQDEKRPGEKRSSTPAAEPAQASSSSPA